MAFNFPFVLPLVIALIALALALSLRAWAWKIVFLIVALGASYSVLTYTTWPSGVALLVAAILFIAVGTSAVRNKGAGSKAVGIVFLAVGVLTLFPALSSLAAITTGTVWDSIVSSFVNGWDAFWSGLGRLVGAS